MKFILGLFTIVFTLFFSLCAHADVVSATSTEIIMSSGDFFQMFLSSLGGLKGAGTIGIVIIILQILFAFLNSELAGKIGFLRDLKPGIKLIVILIISYATGLLTLMNVQGLSFGAAFIHSTSMSSLMVLLNQIYKKFVSDS